MKVFLIIFFMSAFLSLNAEAADLNKKAAKGLVEFEQDTPCEWAKRDGAGTLDWTEVESSKRRFKDARWAFKKWKSAEPESYEECYQMGRKFGDLTYEEMLDKNATKVLSSDEYKTWKLERMIAETAATQESGESSKGLRK